MHLDQNIHAVIMGAGLQLGSARIIKRGHDQEDAVSAEGSGFGNLCYIDDEILAQNWQPDSGARGHQKFRCPLKPRAIGQHRQACGPARLIGGGQILRREISPDQPF